MRGDANGGIEVMSGAGDRQFKLGTFSAPGGVPFPGLVLAGTAGNAAAEAWNDAARRVVPLSRLEPLLRHLNLSLREAGSLRSLVAHWDENLAALTKLCQAAHAELAQASVVLEELQTHAPIGAPRQIFCTIANYRSQIVESVLDAGVPPHTDGMDADARRAYAEKLLEERVRGAPYACFKLPTTVIGPHDPLEIPSHAQRVDWELELGVVIGKPARRVTRAAAMSYVAGYVLVNDITSRDLVRRSDVPNMGTDWLQSKNAPGFLPMGPYLVPAAFVPNPYELRLSLSLNDRPMQNGLVSDMLFDIAAQIEYLSAQAQLLPGDVICTGTPAGCGTHYKRYLQPGDILHSTAPGLGSQRTPCIAERSPRA
jgi:2-keto-4-pentenoate hydratase/2-oxohepta-3-ene-1,7-dioic acid hydratase in catechol pathway